MQDTRLIARLAMSDCSYWSSQLLISLLESLSACLSSSLKTVCNGVLERASLPLLSYIGLQASEVGLATPNLSTELIHLQ
jgi:hypothetical protein